MENVVKDGNFLNVLDAPSPLPTAWPVHLDWPRPQATPGGRLL